RQIHHVGKRAVRTFQPVHAGKAFVGHDGDIDNCRRFYRVYGPQKACAHPSAVGITCAISRATMCRGTKTGMAASSRPPRSAAVVTDRVAHAAGSSSPSFAFSHAVGTFRRRPNETVLMSPFAAAE